MPYKDPEKRREAKRKYYEKNKKLVKSRALQWSKDNRKRRAEIGENYRIKNWEKVQEQRRVSRINRRHTDEGYRILCNLRKRMWAAVKGIDKAASTIELIGCDVDNLKVYIESHFYDDMSWDNYGKWHIDHKIPCARFDFTDPAQQRECFHYTNLQPLWAKENIAKGVN